MRTRRIFGTPMPSGTRSLPANAIRPTSKSNPICEGQSGAPVRDDPLREFHDLQNKLLADKAGTPFDPSLDIPIIADEITIFRYEPSCDRTAQQAYMNAVNTDAWLGAEQYTALMADISVQEEFIQGVYWYATTYQILVKPRCKVPGTADDGTTPYVGGWHRNTS